MFSFSAPTSPAPLVSALATRWTSWAAAGELDCFVAAESTTDVLCSVGDDTTMQYKFTEIEDLKPGKKITVKELQGATVSALRWLPPMP